MDTSTITIIIIVVIAAIVILAAGVWLGIIISRRQRSKNLKKQFGPEYERIVNELGDKEEAETELAGRLEHVKHLELEPLSAEEKEQFVETWRQIQAMFVDQPYEAIHKANQLVNKVMSAKGYPIENNEQRIADLSVNYPELISNYRKVNAIATSSEKRDGISTEEMRQAMIHCRDLFEEMLNGDVNENIESEEVVNEP